MAQIQTVRYPVNGPSWDEEVVPALRKRLESESRTLAKRMSAVSLASQDDHFISMHTDLTTAATYINTRDTPSSPFLQSNASTMRNRYKKAALPTLDPIPANSRPNGVIPSKRKLSSPTPGSALHFQRSRTYSQPYLSEVPYGTAPRQQTKGSPPSISKSLRSPDARPTRIPKPTGRSPPLSIPANISNQDRVFPSPIPSGYHQYTTSTPTTPASHSTFIENGQRTPTAIARPSVSVDVNTNVGLGLLNEPPPFNPASASSSKTPSQRSASPDIEAPRPSTDSEERPFEHWYRGEVSRNGGVGELRVGRRQEMLDIANYGHTIRARERERCEAKTMRRKRADSVSGIGDSDRERGSLHLDDEDARRVGRVLDEAPLTDLDGSEGGHHDDDEVYDNGTRGQDEGKHTWRRDDDTFDEGLSHATSNGTTSPQQETSWTSYDTYSTTPTPTTVQFKRSDSRNASARPSKIPARSRQSSESRVVTPTPIIRGVSEPPSTPSSSHTPPSQSRQRSQQQTKATPNKRAASKPRTPAGKTRAKTVALKKDLDEEAKRRSVAQYPTPPGNDSDEMMIDAIPEWTQPIPHQGNWDEVVLPVVARKKGLDEHYQKADGNPPPRMINTTPAPAPGTFGYDDSKFRRTRVDGDPESIPMDEFGQAQPQVPEPEEEKTPGSFVYQTDIDSHDQTRLPARTAPSPAPFSDYPPGPSTKINPSIPISTTADLERWPKATQQPSDDRDDEGGGCCKCVIM
ncbi:hypothetical protein H2248_007667 [Termitomyces sp. 'cryptogamus']|nr:hypothetical protein H2248_007667 [Termitomyces sp. 'cryptogamus']